MPRTVEEILLDAVGRVEGVDERTVRVIASAVAYVAESVVRGDKIFMLFEFALGASPEDLEHLQAVLDRPTPHAPSDAAWEMDGEDLLARLKASGHALSAIGLLTLSDMQPVIDHYVRVLLPNIDDATIDKTVDEFGAVVEEAAARNERVSFAPKAAERIVEDWIVDHLDELATGCELPKLELIKRQFRFGGGRRPDLVCRTAASNEHFPRGVWVVFELKAGRLLPLDVDQLAEYVELAERELDVDGDGVIGVLIGDGWTEDVNKRRRDVDAGIMCQNLVSIGFHQALFEAVQALELAD
jgi:hypothetical protein